MQKSLKELGKNESAVVVKIGGQGQIRQRLFDMGITPNTKVTMLRAAPLGDPVEITLRGYELSLRKSEAELIQVEGNF